jgi:hypothetical protein
MRFSRLPAAALMLALATLPLTALALEKFDAAAQSGLDGKDCSELLVWWLSQGGHA